MTKTHAIFALLLLLTLPGVAVADQPVTVFVSSSGPAAEVLSISGQNTAHARLTARVSEEAAREDCLNQQLESIDCNKPFPQITFELTANCPKGTLVSSEEGGLSFTLTKKGWRDDGLGVLIDDSQAGGFWVIQNQFEALCPSTKKTH